MSNQGQDARSAASPSPQETLVVVALKTDQAHIRRRLSRTFAIAEPTAVDCEAHVWAKPVDELVAADLDALAAVIGWDAVSRLRVGDVVSVGFHASDGANGGPTDTDDPEGDGDA